MTPGLNIDMSDVSDFNLSFLVDVGTTRWFQGEEKKDKDFLCQDLKKQIPKNKIFQINSLIFNITKHKKEILTKYKCYYEEKSNSLSILFTQDFCFADFTKEIMMNLLELAQKVEIENIYFLVAKKNQQYIKLSSSYHESIKAIDPYIINYKLSKYRIYSEKSKIYSVF